MILKTKVLYVEDDKQWQETVGEIVSALGYQIDYAFTSKEAMLKLKHSTYHVALLDKRLEENNPENEEGLSIATAIAGLGEGTKIIVYTAYGNIEDSREAFRDIKVWDFIGKDRPISEIRKALKESAEAAVLEFRKPARISELMSSEDEAINKFLSGFPSKSGLGSNAQDLELFARRLLGEYRPLLQDRNEAKLLNVSQFPILQVRFWSKMLGFSIAVWIGKFNDMKTILKNIDSDKPLHLSLGISNKIDELFDLNSFSQFGGAIFGLEDASFDEFVSRFEFGPYS